MNIVIWMACGALLGWLAYELLDMSPGRGQAASLVIGGIGGVLGGKLLAPMLGIAAATPDAFSIPSLFIATFAAAVLLFVANYIYNTWRI